MARLKIKLLVFWLIFSACTKDKGSLNAVAGYPSEIGGIVLEKCATSGCHNTQSKAAAGGLSLASWEDLFAGSRNGPVLIPFRPDFSTLCYYTNTFDDLGPTLSPTMPVNDAPLSREEMLRFFEWIREGAANSRGKVKFSAGSLRRKIYITNQLCDVVVVLDAETKLPMRYIDVGVPGKNEFPVCVRVSPDKKNWYVSFLASSMLQKYDAVNDRFTEEVDLGTGLWTGFEISADSRYAICVDYSNPGKVVRVDLDSMKVTNSFSGDLVYPRSVVIDEARQVLFVGAENGNYVTRIDISDINAPFFSKINIEGRGPVHNNTSFDPQVLCFDEASGTCFAGCVNSQELRIIDGMSGNLAGTLSLKGAPTFIDLDRVNRRLFITCMNDSTSFPGHLGSVVVADLESRQIVATIEAGFQPTGICVNNVDGYAVVVNSNISAKGPEPHHTSGCEGRNGYVTFIDLKTLQLLPGKYELAVYPYAVDMR